MTDIVEERNAFSEAKGLLVFPYRAQNQMGSTSDLIHHWVPHCKMLCTLFVLIVKTQPFGIGRITPNSMRNYSSLQRQL